jgi:hypothetical protein
MEITTRDAHAAARHGFARRAAVTVAAVALSVTASPLFSGVALASGHNHHSNDHNGPTYDAGDHNHAGGRGGTGGQGRANCAVPLGLSLGVIGQGGNDSQCNAEGGKGGSGGAGRD